MLLDADSIRLKFRGRAGGVPVTLQVHYNFLEKFRVGLGYTWERHKLEELEPTQTEGGIRPYEPDFESTRISRFFITGGYKFYEWSPYSFVAEAQFGIIRSSKKQFNRDFQTQRFYANIGVGMEQRLSEYFRIIYKASLNLNSYKVALPDSTGSVIRHGNPSLYFQIGVEYQYSGNSKISDKRMTRPRSST